MAEDVEWLRPDFRDKWGELISGPDVVSRAGISRQTFSNWRKSLKTVCLKKRQSGGGHPVPYFVEAEVASYIEKYSERLRDGKSEERYKNSCKELSENNRRLTWLAEQKQAVESQLTALREEEKKLQDRNLSLEPFVKSYEREHGITN
ncbi:hypothetical protein [Streptomyces sp. WZ-12]|uniref:hypothetical protein n=1 Tax=Streptomyces sp. WZ-12 TaxID=3030210 RepID=UPI002380CD7B|nr:hypothetical protein [Streptomyces sp. WZ-12]